MVVDGGCCGGQCLIGCGTQPARQSDQSQSHNSNAQHKHSKLLTTTPAHLGRRGLLAGRRLRDPVEHALGRLAPLGGVVEVGLGGQLDDAAVGAELVAGHRDRVRVAVCIVMVVVVVVRVREEVMLKG